MINKLNNDYNPRSEKKIKEKNRVLESAKKLSDARDEIINFFEKWIFPYKDKTFQTKEKKESEEESEEELKENKFLKYIENESKGINYELFKKHVNFGAPTVMAKKLFETKDKNKNNKLVNIIKSGLIGLKDEIEKMSKEEIEIEKPDKILKVVKEILNFNKNIQKQSGGKGLKILTPVQMLSILPITLAQLKAGNNSEKLKNEIRQSLYCLYRSKKLIKQLYKSLIHII